MLMKIKKTRTSFLFLPLAAPLTIIAPVRIIVNNVVPAPILNMNCQSLVSSGDCALANNSFEVKVAYNINMSSGDYGSNLGMSLLYDN